MNSIIIKGRIVADPELRQTQSNISVCRFRVAVNRSFKEADGTTKADFFSCTAWRQQAEFISKYFKKGQEILVRGEMRNADYTDANGVKHYAMDLLVDKAEFCGSKSDNSGSSSATPNNSNPLGDMSGFEEILSDGDVPF